MTPIDLRSDTLTRPTPQMRAAMASAEVGDDVYREDPTARRLEERAAEVLGKEEALFVPSGTMGNQVALQLLCRPGDEAIVGQGAHLMFYEAGSAAAFAGVQALPVGHGGRFTAADVEAAIKPERDHYPTTRLVAVENTHNRGGGCVFPQGEILKIANVVRRHGLAFHLDGARIWNAAAATGVSEAELCRPFDTVSACFSKGLGAPVGSVIAGSHAAMAGARRVRRRMGGALRQVGVLCAAALYALEHHRERLVEDHDRARQLAQGLAEMPNLECDAAAVETNIVNFDVRPHSAERFVADAAARGVLLNAVGLHRVRAVTHLDLPASAIPGALDILREVTP